MLLLRRSAVPADTASYEEQSVTRNGSCTADYAGAARAIDIMRAKYPNLRSLDYDA